jgi:triosephosphate isomerase
MRKKIVAGNWKMNMDLAEGLKFAGSIDKYFKENPSAKASVILCTPYIHLAGAHEILKHGKVAAWMVKSTGAEYVILGHSERRSYYHEDDKLVNKKTLLAINSGLKVIFCCGEVQSERESGSHFRTVKRQLEEGLFNLTEVQMDMIVIAYEPVWAIGTGLTATPDQAQEMHKFIRDEVKGKYGNDCAKKLPILYGGSCKPSNAKEIFSKPDVDGGLIGGASLKKEDFAGIVEAF